MIRKSLIITVLILHIGLLMIGCPQKTVVKEEPSLKKEEKAKPQREIEIEGEEAAERKEAVRREEAAKEEFEKSLVAKRTPGIEGEVFESKPFGEKQLRKPKLDRKPAEPSAISPVQQDFSKIVEDELKKLSLGKILFNPPKEMIVGIKEAVEVRIAKTIAGDLSAGLRGRGVPQIKEIRVSTFMKVRLTGDNFDIKPRSGEDQLVTGEGFTQWDWDVVPLKSGDQSLLLVVSVRIKIPNDGEERKDYPVFTREISVKVNIIYSIKNFIKSYWQWILSTIIGSGIIGWVIKRMRKSRRKK